MKRNPRPWLGARLAGAAFCLVLSTCAILPRRRMEVAVMEPPAAGARWSLGEIDLEGRASDLEARATLAEMLLMIAARRSLPLDAGVERQLVLDIKVVEREFAADLQIRSSIAFSATLRDRESSATLVRALLTEESGETTRSLYYLQGIADEVLGSLAKRLAKETKGGGR